MLTVIRDGTPSTSNCSFVGVEMDGSSSLPRGIILKLGLSAAPWKSIECPRHTPNTSPISCNEKTNHDDDDDDDWLFHAHQQQ
jgi:hypothetical protein